MDKHSAEFSPEVKRMLGEQESTQLKEAINQLLWTHLPSETTIGDAENMACKIFEMIESGKMD